jgi:hypothetical protein
MAIWNILSSFGTLLPDLVSCTQNNLAALLGRKKIERERNSIGKFFRV